MYINKIKMLLKDKKVNLYELADAIGMSRQGFAKTLEGNSLKVSTLESIAKYFNLPITYFFEERQYDKSQESIIIDNITNAIGEIIKERLALNK